jgi:hypothetical protein
MASALQQLSVSTVNITEKQYDDLIRQSEQLRILKNFARNEKIFMSELLALIDAMEGKANE